MLLSQLLSVALQPALSCFDVAKISIDSRDIAPQAAYVDVSANVSFAIDYARTVLEQRHAVVISDKPEVVELDPARCVLVESAFDALAIMSARFYHNPSYGMSCIGVTGTNGKTTVAYMLAQLFDGLGLSSAYSGTLGAGRLGSLVNTGFTSPPAHQFQAWLAQMKQADVKTVVAEVSSHALEQKRADLTQFKTAVFTNFTQDHLDYHGSMAAYAAAKRRLFAFPSVRNAVINIDDPMGKELAKSLSGDRLLLCFSLFDSSADYYCSDVHYNPQGLKVTIHSPTGVAQVQTALVGTFNLYNLLSIVAAAELEGFAFDDIAATVPTIKAPPGRMEFVGLHKPVVVVDYAHTPDALENAAANLRHHLPKTGQLHIVFGCGGDRDKDKRVMMGRAASALGDSVILTSDNPRTEDPLSIIQQIEKGVDAEKSTVIADRAHAIEVAISRAKAEDIVLIAGKGHECYQIMGTEHLPFSDVECADAVLKEMRK